MDKPWIPVLEAEGRLRAPGANTADVDGRMSPVSFGATARRTSKGRSVTCLRHERRSAGWPAGPGARKRQDRAPT